MTEFCIEKDVPVPASKGRPHGGLSEVLRQMEVGDSVFAKNGRELISSIASTIGRTSKKKFTVRKEGRGARVWRVE